MLTAATHMHVLPVPQLPPYPGRSFRADVRDFAPVNAITQQQQGEAQLMARVAAGDDAAVGELYDRYGRVVYSLARRIVRDPDLSNEVVQDVFVAVWQKAAQYDPTRARVVTWLMTLAHNKAIDRVRREGVQRRDVDPSPIDDQVAAPADLDTEHVVVAADTASSVRRAVAELPPKQREVIELGYFGGFSQSELAERLDLPLGTVKTRMFHGMRRLRELLESQEPGEGGGA